MYLWAALVAFGTVLVSLYSKETWTWVVVGSMAVVTVGATFLLPKLHHPELPPPDTGEGGEGTPGQPLAEGA